MLSLTWICWRLFSRGLITDCPSIEGLAQGTFEESPVRSWDYGFNFCFQVHVLKHCCIASEFIYMM